MEAIDVMGISCSEQNSTSNLPVPVTLSERGLSRLTGAVPSVGADIPAGSTQVVKPVRASHGWRIPSASRHFLNASNVSCRPRIHILGLKIHFSKRLI